MMNWVKLPAYAVHLKNRCSSFISADSDTGLEQRQVLGIMLVSALVSRDHSFSLSIEKILREKADGKTLTIAKYAAVFAEKKEDGSKKKILIVDDEIRLTRMLKRTLENTGQFNVKTENKGTNVREVVSDFKPDLVLLDILMPDKNGIEIARQIEKDIELCHTKVVFLTGLMGAKWAGSPTKDIDGHLCVAKQVSDEDLVNIIEDQVKISPTC